MMTNDDSDLPPLTPLTHSSNGIYRPVVVVGTGRCGTSTTCRILHQNLGVRMYENEFLRPDAWNPKGYFEDRKIKRLNKEATSGGVTPETWRDQMYQHMQAEKSPWGFKLQPLEAMPENILAAMEPRRVIACVRDRSMTAASIKNWHRRKQWDGPKDSQQRYDKRATAMKAVLNGHVVLWLDFSFERTDEDLEAVLRAFVHGP